MRPAVLAVDDLGIQVTADCFYHNLVPIALEALISCDIPVPAVSTRLTTLLLPPN
jgi:hypothetical protein